MGDSIKKIQEDMINDYEQIIFQQVYKELAKQYGVQLAEDESEEAKVEKMCSKANDRLKKLVDEAFKI